MPGNSPAQSSPAARADRGAYPRRLDLHRGQVGRLGHLPLGVLDDEAGLFLDRGQPYRTRVATESVRMASC
jgi:hypothetical protein